jgi:flagellar hook-length control protein FliK
MDGTNTDGARANAATPDRTNALPLHADPEHVGIDTRANPIAAMRTPFGERTATDPAAAVAMAAAPRELDALRGASASAPGREASLQPSIDEAGFGPALGAQVALWVRDGVQEARLQLHPAELGPINVQIALDGQLAHVDFVAAVPATRDSLEQSLPALAAALRESGFTLAGGGVSGQAGQHGGQGRRDGDGQGREFRTPGDGLDNDNATAATAPRRWSRSLVDIYA